MRTFRSFPSSGHLTAYKLMLTTDRPKIQKQNNDTDKKSQ